MKRRIVLYPIRHAWRKKFSYQDGRWDNESFWEPKDQKFKKPLNISKKVFIAFSKFYGKHRTYEILPKSLVPTVHIENSYANHDHYLEAFWGFFSNCKTYHFFQYFPYFLSWHIKRLD